ncbi:MAG TPA: DedA family protein [Deltaproteobacteria bacterium]|nr:DedA family protein [Deltaproteobacteria bacterium]HPR52204.1 DedA family protein [Deltaproteobacteria bacterium]
MLEHLIETYGYLAVLIGTFFEGETILVLAGFAAHRGYLSLPWVILAAFAGTLCADQLMFYLGRRHSQGLLARRPSWRKRIDKAQRLLKRFHTPLILSFRFLYGLRTVTPFVIGMSTVPAWKFIVFNFIGALVWAVAIGSGGYIFGSALEILIGDIKRYEYSILGLITLTGAGIWAIHLYRCRKGSLSDAASCKKT